MDSGDFLIILSGNQTLTICFICIGFSVILLPKSPYFREIVNILPFIPEYNKPILENRMIFINIKRDSLCAVFQEIQHCIQRFAVGTSCNLFV